MVQEPNVLESSAWRTLCGLYSVDVVLNTLMGTLKPQSKAPLYSGTVIGTLAVYGWAVTFGTARGMGGLPPHPVTSSLYQM